MFYVDDINKLQLDSNLRYTVQDTTRCRRYECMLAFQSDFIFLFKITDTNILNNKICISKVDYYLNSNLIYSIENFKNKTYNGRR